MGIDRGEMSAMKREMLMMESESAIFDKQLDEMRNSIARELDEGGMGTQIRMECNISPQPVRIRRSFSEKLKLFLKRLRFVIYGKEEETAALG